MTKTQVESHDWASEKAFPWVLCFPGGSEGKAPACKAGDLGSILGLGSSPGEGNGNPLQYPCLENPTDGRAWWATVHGVAKSRTWLSELTSLLWDKSCEGLIFLRGSKLRGFFTVNSAWYFSLSIFFRDWRYVFKTTLEENHWKDKWRLQFCM